MKKWFTVYFQEVFIHNNAAMRERASYMLPALNLEHAKNKFLREYNGGQCSLVLVEAIVPFKDNPA